MYDGTTHSASAAVIASYFYPFSSHQLSVLREEPTVIVDLDKESECYNGIGEKGFVVVPEQTHQKVRDNLEYYLEKAGLIEKTTKTKSPERPEQGGDIGPPETIQQGTDIYGNFIGGKFTT
jgi:hypothetical protein